MDNKDEKKKELIRELAAEFFSRESNRTSLITVTGVELFSHGSRAKILFTVMPENQENAARDFMHRQLSDLREFIMIRARMMRVPFLEVSIDRGEKNRQKLDEIGKRL